MPELGYSLSSEEFSPSDLVRFARRAEEAGFAFAVISDHFHPWTASKDRVLSSGRHRRDRCNHKENSTR
jgi:alkanesulfonate monooxygenase SsuD/methylene tetrahydromethanopterin reductase-like flavin-dependent oxidoreductase (luciferase family)